MGHIQPKADDLLPQTGTPWRFDNAPPWERDRAVAWCRAQYGAWRDLDAKRAEIDARPAYVPA